MQTVTWVLLVLANASSVPDQPNPILVVNLRREAVSVAFSPNGRILTAGSAPNGIMFWDAKTGEEIRRIAGAEVGEYIAFSPDGKTLASVRNWQQGESAGTIQLWEVATGELRGQLNSDKNLIRCVAFSPDGKYLASHSQWGTDHVGAVRVWELATGRELLKIPTNDAGHTVAFSPDGKLLAFDIKYTVHLRYVKTAREFLKLEGHQEIKTKQGISSGYLNALAFSPDGSMLGSASCDNTGRIWDVATGKTVQVLEGHHGFVNTIAFFPDGKTVATGGEDGTLRVWEVATGRQLNRIQAHERVDRQDGDRRKDIFAIAISPDGKRLASGGRDTAVRVWDVGTLLKNR